MNPFDDRIKLDIFKEETTYQNDYKKNLLKRPKESSKKALWEPKRVHQRPYFIRDNETFVRRRPDVQIPFDALWRPKDITQTNPYEPFNTPVLPDDPNKEEIIKTRPRIFMSPAVGIDDVEDPEIRKLICSHMYTPEWTKAIQETAVEAAKRHVSNTTVEKCGDSVQLKTDVMPPLPPGFRNRGKKWENAQIKYSVDPTRTFWEHKKIPVRCGACYDPIAGLVQDETKQKIRELINQDKLRLAHDAPIPGYAGYKPRFSYGVSLAKIEMPVVHPFLSVSQAITKRYAENRSKFQ